jgi:peptidyl-prolyl cis-trans isomerase SurA
MSNVTMRFFLFSPGRSIVLLTLLTLVASGGLHARGRIIEADRVIAVVGDEAITQVELREQVRGAVSRLKSQGTPLPPEDVLEKQMLERMIMNRAQTQLAREYGMQADDAQVEHAIARIAVGNKMTMAELQGMLKKDGISYAAFREDIRDDILISRLRDRELDSRLVITDAEIDNYLAQTSGQHEAFRVAHILLRAPEGASPEQLRKLAAKAADIRQKAVRGNNFAELAAAYSDAPDALRGGDLGLRPLSALPGMFAETLQTLQAGEISPVLQSSNGFHLLKLLEREGEAGAGQPDGHAARAHQTQARHILIRPDEILSETEARRRLADLRERLRHGEDFAELARRYSQDGSAVNGGDLGWVNPGDTVPEFERVMDALAAGEVSEVTQSPFGFHLILVEARRVVDMRDEQRRAQARSIIRERKLEDAYQDWLRQLRDKTYVEYRLDE